MMITKIVKDMLTGIDNETFDHGRILCVLSYLMYFGLAVASFWMLHPWGAMDFAGGIGAMGVGFGVHLKLKEGTEPNVSQS